VQRSVYDRHRSQNLCYEAPEFTRNCVRDEAKPENLIGDRAFKRVEVEAELMMRWQCRARVGAYLLQPFNRLLRCVRSYF
jgi:hypothetical protein